MTCTQACGDIQTGAEPRRIGNQEKFPVLASSVFFFSRLRLCFFVVSCFFGSSCSPSFRLISLTYLWAAVQEVKL